MTSFLTLLQVYVFGGLTFIPLLFLGIFLHGYLTFPHVQPSSLAAEHDDLRDTADDDKNIVSGESSLAEKLRKGHDKDAAEGYFAVCREYVPGGVNGKPPVRTTPAGQVIAQESPSVYQNMYRSLFERKQGSTLDPSKADGIKSVKRARNIFYVVLRHGHLMLYDDSEQVEVRHVISLAHHDISIFGGGHAIPEGELWIKRNAICLKRRASTLDKGTTTLPFFFFSENCSDKEDFYFALLRSQDKTNHDGPPPPQVQEFDVKDIISLVQRLHSSEEHLQTRWLNALIGRLFLALYKTKFMENFVRAKITKKISRVKKPAILSKIVLRDVKLGHSAPLVTNPKLRDLNVDGEYCAEMHLSYEGGFRVEIGATARLDLGQRFKAREVTLILAIVIKKLEGKLLVRMKPPPSNRIWIAFETMPQLELSVEPIVSSRQITYSIVLRAIESRIREVLAETLVLPHWDDSPFCETLDELFRGGIWAQEDLEDPEEQTEIPDDAAEDEAETDAGNIASLKTNDERAQSMPYLPATAEDRSRKLGHRKRDSGSVKDEPAPAERPQHSEKPKVLRTSSFASAADPIVSTDNINMEAEKIPKKKSKPQKDAASYISEINSRSSPSSPVATPVGRKAESADSRDLAGSFSSTSSIADVLDDKFSISQHNIASHDHHTASGDEGGPVMQSVKGPIPQTKLAGLAKTLTPSEKKQQAMLAAAAAAKNWGWNTFNKKQKQSMDAQNGKRVGTPENPLGRGQPLPPPGVPLPGPEGKRASVLSLSLPKRKPVPDAIAQPSSEESRRTPPLPPREHRRTNSIPVPEGAAKMMIIEAPKDSLPSSPVDDYGEFMDNVMSEDDDKAHGSPAQTRTFVAEPEEPTSPMRREISASYENEDDHGLATWKIAQEEEARQKNLWMNEHEHNLEQ